MIKNEGITLVALVITVIILLILAGVAISMITGGDGLFAKANEASRKYNEAARNEANTLESMIHELNKISSKLETEITNIKCREFTINAKIDGIEEEIQEIEYFVNGELKGKTRELSYLIEGLEPETEYDVYIKAYNKKGQAYISSNQIAKTANKTYLVKDGKQINMSFYPFNATINTSYTDCVRVETSYTTSRGGVCVDIDLTNFSRLYMDVEIIYVKLTSTQSAIYSGIMQTYQNVLVDSSMLLWGWSDGVVSAPRTVQYFDVSNITGTVRFLTAKNAVGDNGNNAVFQIYNIWLED